MRTHLLRTMALLLLLSSTGCSLAYTATLINQTESRVSVFEPGQPILRVEPHEMSKPFHHSSEAEFLIRSDDSEARHYKLPRTAFHGPHLGQVRLTGRFMLLALTPDLKLLLYDANTGQPLATQPDGFPVGPE